MTRMQGHFIVIEGLDGAGSTTQVRLLGQWLRDRGADVLETAEPSGGPLGVLIRKILQGEQRGSDGHTMHPDSIAALFVADRVDHIACEIEPALARGSIVISDRYVHSSLAYQGVECDLDWVATMNAPMRRPDLTIFVDVDPTEAGRRRSGRAGDPELYEHDSFQAKVAEGYARARQLRPEDRVEVVDGTGSVETVFESICTLVEARLLSGQNRNGG